MSEELHVRLFLRRVFIDQCKSKTDKAFWLNLILKPYPMVQQARIIFLLYGPLYGGTPDEWLPENTANLLFLCGDCITLKVLSSKAINGRVQELGSIITSLCLVCWRHSQPVTWAVDIVHNLCSLLEHPRERVSFLHTIIDTFREVILDLHEFGDSEDDGSQDFQNMMDAQADFSRELIILAFQNIIKA